jgi:signal transduction histidine kinase
MVWVDNYSKPIIYEGKAADFITVIDITDRKKAEDALKKSEEKYREAYNRSDLYKDIFTHDINNILQNILSSVELSKLFSTDPTKTEKIKEVSNLISEQIIRGKKLVSNVQKLSEVEEIKTPLSSIEASKVLTNAIEFVKGSFPHKSLNIQTESFQEQHFVIANDLLVNIFENILFNAIKHNINEKIEILIRISRKIRNGINFIKFEFLDNGVGIPDSMKKEIFSRYYRGYKKDRVPSGIGLGLLLIKRIIDSYNGKIEVEDKIKGDYSKGSNFMILIPEAI